MPAYSRPRIAKFLREADQAPMADAKGTIFEDLVTYLFQTMPGITQVRRNVSSVFRSEELDLVLLNTRHPQGLIGFDLIIPIECKSCLQPVSSKELSWFIEKIRRRALNIGFLVAAHGITGDPRDLTAAHDIASSALKEGIRLVVLTRLDLEGLESTDDLVILIQTKLCDLVIKRTPLI